MKNNKRLLAALLAMAMALGCAACGSSSSQPAAPAAPAETKAEEQKADAPAAEVSADGLKTLVIGTGQTCTLMDPTQNYDGWYSIRFGICQTLTQMKDDMTISGWLVEDDYSVSEDMTTWTFHIKDGVTFSNGNPLTAEAAKASLEYTVEHSTRTMDYFTPTAIQAEGQTLTITTDQPEPILPNKLADPLFSIIDTTADTEHMDEQGPTGTGPFVLESFDSVTKEVTVVRNENYWNGDVKLDRADIICTEDQSALTMSLQVGEFDALYNVSMNFVSDFENDPNFLVEKSASGRTTHGFMNQNGVLKDHVLREAIMQLLDKQSFVDNLLNGQYVAGKTLITSAAAYGYDELTDPNAYNPDHAVKMLADAGYADQDGDGFLETPSGEPMDLQFVYYTGRPEQQVIVEATQMVLAEYGIKVTPVLNESQQVMDRLMAGDYDLLCMSINVLNCADPENHLNTYFKTGGSYQSCGWSNPDFDAILDELSETADPAARIQLVKDAEQILMDDAVFMAFCYPIMNFTMKNTVSGIRCTTADYYWINENTQIQ